MTGVAKLFSTRADRQQNRWRKVMNVAARRAADTCGHDSDGSAVQNWASPGVRNLIRSTQRGVQFVGRGRDQSCGYQSIHER